MRPKIISLAAKNLARTAAEKGFRINGRGLKAFRKCQVKFGKSYGSCEVVFEPGTRVFVQISASIGEPMDSRPGEGALTISVWISPSATGEMSGGGSQKPALIARALDRLFKENRAVDLESLCIKFGERAWILRADVHIIDANGCLTEASALGVLGALLTFRRAQAHIEVNTNKLILYSIEESTPVKLHLFHLPMITSFALCDGNKLLSEPDHEEEEIFQGKLMIGVNDSKELCFLHLTNPIDQDVLMEATRLAEAKCLERIRWLKKLVTEDEKERDVPLYMKKEGVRKTGIVIEAADLQQKLSLIENQSHSLPEGQGMSSKTAVDQIQSIPLDKIFIADG